MCGFVGIASQSRIEKREWLSDACNLIRHRGPDAGGQYWTRDGRVGLGHQRLAILDLSEAAHQPMRDEKRELALVFNGEIYNFGELRGELECYGYEFRTRSDTEVLLASYAIWGTDCLSRLNGMFSFALFDGKRNKIFLARDRAGEKPLFYYEAKGVLVFASELKALMRNGELPRRIDPIALDCYLAMGFVPGDRCILDGYNKLPPAHGLCFDLASGVTKVWRYWQLPDLAPETLKGPLDDITLLDELEELLEDSVRRQLVADVPVGILLSGGVDSSLITAMAVRHSNKIRTFSIGFPGHGQLDETAHARLIASHFGTEHTELMAHPTTAKLVPKLARQFDEPIVDSSMIPTFLVSEIVREHCKVALGGDGGDELFGGYIHYSRLIWLAARLGHIPLSLRSTISRSAGYLMPVGLKGRNWLQGLGVDLKRGLPLVASYFDETTRAALMASYGGWRTVAESIRRARVPRHFDLLQRATRMDFENYLPEDILVKVDRSSMLNSLEIRAPLLDHKLIEFAFSKVPSHLKATRTDKKILLKRLTQRLLPGEFDRQRKQGFSIPLAQWLRNGLFRDLFHEVLLDRNCMFDRGVVRTLLRGQDRGRSNGERLFALVLFELWRQEYSVTL